MTDHLIPVTILTGFLGSGKTTLLNHLIRSNPERKIAVIENEFGEISIDSDLVVNKEGAVFELANGCVCCSLNGELVETLQMLIAREEKMEHLIIETTGIADPGPVALSFLSDYEVQIFFRLDAIVTVVDSRFVEQQLESQPEVGKQVALADVLLLNKSDEVEPFAVETVKNIVQRINPQALVFNASFGKTDEVNLLDLKAFNPETILKQKWKKPTIALKLAPNYKHTNHIALGSHSFEIEKPLDIIKFDAWVAMMLYMNSSTIFRIKGILNIAESDDKLVFQSVYNQYVSQSGGKWTENDVRKTRIVFIGKNLDRSALENGLNQCEFSGY